MHGKDRKDTHFIEKLKSAQSQRCRKSKRHRVLDASRKPPEPKNFCDSVATWQVDKSRTLEFLRT
jgi:hypothetical protein